MSSGMNTRTTIEPENVKTLEKRPFRDEIYYPESHDDDMGESIVHYKLISYLFSALHAFFSANEEVMIAANLNLYFREGDPRKYYTPDLMIAFGAEKRNRQVYKLWEEKVFPQIVFEIASERTWKNDIGEKSEFYAEFGTEEYYLIDVERKYLPLPLMSYRLRDGRLRYVPLENDRVFSPLLKLEIVDTGKSFRLFDPARKEFLQAVLTGEE
jgi:Uma2 family endonuclease